MTRPSLGQLLSLLVLSGIVATGCQRTPAVADDPIGALTRGRADASASRTVARGRLLFVSTCATCHGDDASGRGQNASRLDPRPTDLRGVASRWSPQDLRVIVLHGTAATGRSPLCPPRAGVLGADDVDAVMAFLQRLGTGPHLEQGR
jgi:mono/diheme cytochrome c family protein